MPLEEVEVAALRTGAASLGVALDADAVDRIGRYVFELRRWMSRINLVARGDAAILIERHVVDSLAAVPFLEPLAADARIADVGSGAGLPGIPLAIALRTRRLLLVEPRQKRASFLRAAVRAVAGPPFEVCEARFEDLAKGNLAGSLSAVVTRAALASEALLAGAGRLLRPGGLVIAYRSTGDLPGGPAQEGFLAPERHLYRAPAGGAQRSLVIWRRADG